MRFSPELTELWSKAAEFIDFNIIVLIQQVVSFDNKKGQRYSGAFTATASALRDGIAPHLTRKPFTQQNNPMAKLTALTSYADAQANFSSEKLWELFDGNRECLNIAHECVDRYALQRQTAVIVLRTDAPDELISYEQLAKRSSQMAHFLAARSIKRATALRSCLNLHWRFTPVYSAS